MSTADQPLSTATIGMKADLMRSDLQRGLVWFLNYAACDPSGVTAEQLDLHSTSMLPADVELFAHRWLAFSRSMDINHDGIGRPLRVVESFFNSSMVASPMWPLNAHAMRVDVSGSEEAMSGLRSGALNSLSLDAFTFNVKKRLPVAKAVRSAPGSIDFASIARTIVSAGFPGVCSLHRVDDGLFVAVRSSGTPIGVQVVDDGVEIDASGGAWAGIGVALATSATLVHKEADDLLGGYVPDHSGVCFPADYRPWDPADVERLLASVGVEVGGAQPLVPWAYVSTEGVGALPHHTLHGVNVQAVANALSELGSVPEQHRDAARRHLLLHLGGSR